MQPEDNKLILVVVVIAIIMLGSYGALVVHTGFSTPFSMVMSESMQHDDTRSQIGIIDTGDAVITGNTDKFEIQSYVDGTKTGFQSFGDYGNVIIYDHWRNTNPVIHRAIVWLDYDPASDRWSAPSLADYKGEWTCRGNDYNDLKGDLVFKDLTQSKKTVRFNLDTFENKKSGFLTLGDNPVTNTGFDQNSGSSSYLVSMDKIESIALYEIPWIGSLKILIKNDGENLDKVPNSIPSLIMAMVVFIGIFLILDLIIMKKEDKEIIMELKRMGKL